MLIMLPDWYSEAKKKLEDCIDDIIRKNNIDWGFAHDSNSIKDAKETILMALFTIWEKVDVESRKRMEEFGKEIEKGMKKESNTKKLKKKMKK